MHLYLLIYFLSGFSALIYEVVWAKLLTLTFGSTIVAGVLVITTFMLGLGLGGLYFGSLSDRIKNPVKLFSYLQFGISALATILLFLLPVLPAFFKKAIGLFGLNNTSPFSLMVPVAIIVLLPPAFFMGGTFPVMNKIYISEASEIKKGIGLLYGLNTIGGVLGAILTGFFFIRNLGIQSTQLLAIITNMLMGIFTFFLRVDLSLKIMPKPNGFKQESLISYRVIKIIPLVAGMSGFASLACEILWIRALSIFLTNSTYTFSIILAVFLSGIFLGSLIFTRISYRYKLDSTFALVQILTGLYIILGCIFMNKMPELLFLFQDILEIPIFRIFLPALLLSLVVLLIPAIFMGISFPLLCSLYNQEAERLGTGTGRVYFTNTIGGALGSFFAGLFLIQMLGVIKGLVFLALINLFLGLLFTIRLRKKILNFALTGLAIIFALFSAQKSYILPPSIYRMPGRHDRVLYYKETRDGTIVVSEDRLTGVKSCYVNNSAVIGTTYDALKVVKMLGTLPFVFNPEAKNVLVIGFGVGITTATIARYDIEKIDCVELCPGLFAASRYFADFNKQIFNNPEVNFIANDGRNFLLLSDKKYDIISCDPTHPILGSGNLYTEEYFLLCKKHLSENGIVCQYLPFHKLNPDEFKSLIRTFARIFPYTSIWLGFSHGILVGTNFPQRVKFDDLKNIKDEMLQDPYLFATSCLLDHKAIEDLKITSRINTDNQPILEFFTPASLRRENWELNMKFLFEHRIEIERVFEGIEDPARLQRYLLGQHYFIEGLIYQNRSDRRGMIQSFQQALKVNPENQEIRLFLQSR